MANLQIATNWTASADGSYRSSNPAGDYTAPVGLAVDRLVDFNGLSSGQSVTRDTPGFDAAGSFDYWGTYANGYGSQAVTDFAYSGSTSSAEISIEIGSDGGLGGGTGPNGAFGGGFSSAINAAQPEVAKGEEMWLGYMLYIPVGFNFGTNITPGLKAIRFSQPGQTAKIEHHFGDQGASSSNSGINILSEFQPVADSFSTHILDRTLIEGQWNWVECYVKASDVASECERRVWINDQMVIERVAGVNTRYHAAGDWQTQTHAVSEYILSSAVNYLSGSMFVTYWNGGSPATQKLWIQRAVMHKTGTDLSATDEFSNKMIGSISGMLATQA